MEEYLQIFTTTQQKADAEKIARALVDGRLAACIQIVGPIVSTYWWKGKVETTEEWLCLLKSEKTLYAELEQAIKAIHPYETPEIIAVPIVAGNKDYLEWLRHELREESRSRQ